MKINCVIILLILNTFVNYYNTQVIDFCAEEELYNENKDKCLEIKGCCFIKIKNKILDNIENTHTSCIREFKQLTYNDNNINKEDNYDNKYTCNIIEKINNEVEPNYNSIENCTCNSNYNN